MSAHADKTLHWKISGNIHDTDTFSPYPFLKNVIFRHEFVHEFMREFVSTKFEFLWIFARKIGCRKWPVLQDFDIPRNEWNNWLWDTYMFIFSPLKFDLFIHLIIIVIYIILIIFIFFLILTIIYITNSFKFHIYPYSVTYDTN